MGYFTWLHCRGHVHRAGDVGDDGDGHPLLLWSPGEMVAEGKRGPSWRNSNTGGASAASRYRPTTKQGLQGLRFAPSDAGRRPGCRATAGVAAIVWATEGANLSANRDRRYAPAIAYRAEWPKGGS